MSTTGKIKDALVTVGLLVLAIAACVWAGWMTFAAPQKTVDNEVRTDAEEVVLLKEREIIDSLADGSGKSAVVRYAYVGAALPAKLDPEEVVSRRTQESWTKKIGTEPNGAPILTTIIFPQRQFIDKGDAWYYIEYDTARKKNFDASLGNPVTRLFISVAHAATATIYAGAGDGQVHYDTGCSGTDFQTAWDTAHDAATGTAFDYTASQQSVNSYDQDCGGKGGAQVQIDRIFFPFVTSTIPATAIIQSVTLNLYVNSITNNNSGYLTVVQTSQATHTQLATADFDQCGAVNSPTEGVDSGDRRLLSGLTNGAYNAFTLNGTGRGWIKKSGQTSNCSGTAGITCLGIREKYDAEDTATLPLYNGVEFLMSEFTGTGSDPYLSITYVPGFAFWQFQDF